MRAFAAAAAFAAALAFAVGGPTGARDGAPIAGTEVSYDATPAAKGPEVGASLRYGPAEAEVDLAAAVAYLRRSPTAARLLARVERANARRRPRVEIVANRFEEDSTASDPDGLVIRVFWDPRLALRTADGGSQTPAVALAHELAHALHEVEDPGSAIAARAVPDRRYDDREEARTIRWAETPIARELGEDERADHDGRLVVVGSATERPRRAAGADQPPMSR